MIIFDLDDTLIDTTGSITPLQLQRALRAMVGAGLHLEDWRRSSVLLEQIDHGSESSSQTLKEFLDRVGGAPSLLEVGQKVVYGRLPEDVQVTQMQNASQVLQNLKKSHELALVSIGNPDEQRLKMEKAGLDSAVFSKIVIVTGEDKKPAYREVLEALNIAPAKTVVCADRVGRDLRPAKELGCTTVQMQWGRGLSSAADPAVVDFKIRQLGELEQIMEIL